MNKILCICDTPLQILNMINVISTYYTNDKRDLIITDEIKNYEILIKNIQETSFFDKVFLVKEDFMKTVKTRKGIKKIFELFFYRKRIIKQLCFKDKYDKIFIWGRNWLNIFIVKKLHKNNAWQLILIDEGTASYSTHGLYWKENNKQMLLSYITPIKIIKKLMGIDYLYRNISMQYLYRPELADYEVPFKRSNLPFLGQKNTQLFKQMFGYNDSFKINEKYIYFDGAGDVDGLYGNDKELLEMVSTVVGKENLLVKVHPRSSTEWYVNHGYHINTNVSIPWEVYCLDKENLRNKVLISVFSTAIISPYLYFDMEIKVISLIHLFNNSAYDKYYRYLLNYIENNIFLRRKDIFLLPRNIEEFKFYLK